MLITIDNRNLELSMLVRSLYSIPPAHGIARREVELERIAVAKSVICTWALQVEGMSAALLS